MRGGSFLPLLTMIALACGSDGGGLATGVGAGAGGGGGATTAGPGAGGATGGEAPAGGGGAAPTWDCGAFDCEAAEAGTTLGTMTALDGCAFELALEDPASEALADALLDRIEGEGLGTRRTLDDVLANLNREGRSGLTAGTQDRLSGLSPVGFRWNTGDDAVTYWYPQGITGNRDSGQMPGRRLLMVSWYHKTETLPVKGARVSLVDIGDLGDVRYRHLLLVDPEGPAASPTFDAARYDSGGALHAGGIVWYGRYLYVADTSQGLRIYDLGRIFQPTHTDDTDRVGLSPGRSDAFGYLYVVPRIARHRLTRESCRVRFSFVGLDRDADPPALVTGEYDANAHDKRLAVWPLDPRSHQLEVREGTTRAQLGAVIGQTRAQGGLRIGDDFYVSCSSQDGSFGRLYKGRPGSANASIPWVYGAEDLYHEPESGLLWTPAEHPGSRDVVAVPVD